MPTFIKPDYVHVSGGRGGGPAWLIPVAVTGGLLFAAVKWVSDHAAGIEEAIYAVFAVGAVAGVAVLAWVAVHVLRNPTPHTRRQIVALTDRIRAGNAAPVEPVRVRAEVLRPAAVPVPAIASQPPAEIHQHLHVHGIAAADVAEAVADYMPATSQPARPKALRPSESRVIEREK